MEIAVDVASDAFVPAFLEVARLQNPSSLPGLKHSIGASGSIWLPPASEFCDDKAASARGRASRRDQDNLESRSLRAEMLVSLGELSSSRQALGAQSWLPETRPR